MSSFSSVGHSNQHIADDWKGFSMQAVANKGIKSAFLVSFFPNHILCEFSIRIILNFWTHVSTGSDVYNVPEAELF